MFHIGVATQHPPLPEPGQLSELGINFIKQCLTIDPIKRPSAVELTDHTWMLEFRDALLRYEETEITK
jgi:mitogen-activated protein kinase kinase kinase